MPMIENLIAIAALAGAAFLGFKKYPLKTVWSVFLVGAAIIFFLIYGWESRHDFAVVAVTYITFVALIFGAWFVGYRISILVNRQQPRSGTK